MQDQSDFVGIGLEEYDDQSKKNKKCDLRRCHCLCINPVVEYLEEYVYNTIKAVTSLLTYLV